MQNKYFDSCVYPVRNNLVEIKNLSKIYKKKNQKGLIQLTEDAKLQKYSYIKKNFDNLYPLIHITKKQILSDQLIKIKNNKIKNIKIHPRFLNKKISEHFSYYKKIFSFCGRNRINIFFCTFSSWENKVLETNDLNEIAKLSNLLKENKLILMHGGGSKILNYYEKFRFKENVIIDLSYTIQHFRHTTLIKDILFCIKNLDSRIILGSDYPSKKISEYHNVIKLLEKKITKKKLENIVFKNLNNLINNAYKK
tara:strand:+ start:313 stop:1068 length:756 start_codon:yes stop_codon:yes gene_type:complete